MISEMRYVETGWKENLPEDMAFQAIEPHRFEYFEEPQASAEKMLGYDQGGHCCYYRHVFTIYRDVLDDEDNFYEEVSYHEILTAWLLNSGLWLCCKNSKTGMGCNSVAQPCYELAHDRPR